MPQRPDSTQGQRVTVIIMLTEPALAQTPVVLRASYRRALLDRQRQLIDELTPSPFNGVLVNQTLFIANSVTMTVDQTSVNQIQALPGVQSITVDRPLYPDEPSGRSLNPGSGGIERPVEQPTSASE